MEKIDIQVRRWLHIMNIYTQTMRCIRADKVANIKKNANVNRGEKSYNGAMNLSDTVIRLANNIGLILKTKFFER